MPYSVENRKGQTYFLHSRLTQLRGGREQRIYYFARQPSEGAMDALPDGFEVSENERTGLPLLKRKAAAS